MYEANELLLHGAFFSHWFVCFFAHFLPSLRKQFEKCVFFSSFRRRRILLLWAPAVMISCVSNNRRPFDLQALMLWFYDSYLHVAVSSKATNNCNQDIDGVGGSRWVSSVFWLTALTQDWLQHHKSRGGGEWDLYISHITTCILSSLTLSFSGAQIRVK